MNKRALLEQVIAALTAELEGYARSAKAAQAEATDEQSKAENKYDTRGLEASYLARGQSRQAAETAQALRQYLDFVPAEFGPDAAIDLGALAEVEHGGERTLYFMGPCAGGTEVSVEGREAVVITPQSPLGRELMGKKAGAQFTMAERGQPGRWKIVTIR